MNYRTLGRTGLSVSELGFGCGNVGGLMIRGEPQEQVRSVARAIELGINYFDTAPSYGSGQSETNLGRVLKELKADVHVGTKVRLESDDLGDIKPAVIGSAESSLERLGRSYVDLLQLHNRVALRREIGRDLLGVEDVLGEVLEAFCALQEQGKVRFFGITGFGETPALHRVVDARQLYTVQTCYNLLNPSAADDVPAGFPAQDFGHLAQRSAEKGMGVIVIRVLAGGALSGSESRHPVASAAPAPMGTGRDYAEDLSRAKALDFLVAEGHVESLTEASLRFALAPPEVSTVLLGSSSLDQLEEAVRYSSRGALPAALLERLPEVWSKYAGV